MMSRGQGTACVYKDKISNELVVIKKYGKPRDEIAIKKERDFLKSLQSKHIVTYYNSFPTKDNEYWVGLLWYVH